MAGSALRRKSSGRLIGLPARCSSVVEPASGSDSHDLIHRRRAIRPVNGDCSGDGSRCGRLRPEPVDASVDGSPRASGTALARARSDHACEPAPVAEPGTTAPKIDTLNKRVEAQHSDLQCGNKRVQFAALEALALSRRLE